MPHGQGDTLARSCVLTESVSCNWKLVGRWITGLMRGAVIASTILGGLLVLAASRRVESHDIRSCYRKRRPSGIITRFFDLSQSRERDTHARSPFPSNVEVTGLSGYEKRPLQFPELLNDLPRPSLDPGMRALCLCSHPLSHNFTTVLPR